MKARVALVVMSMGAGGAASWAQVPLGPEFRSNSHTTGVQDRASVASDGAGNFVVTWHGGASQAFASYDIFGRRFDPSGAAIDADDLAVNVNTVNAQALPSVAADPSGRFVVAWVSPDGAGYGVSARRYDAAGVSQGDELRVNTYTTNWQLYPAVAVAGDGSFVVVWASDGQDGDDDGVVGQRFDAQGIAQGSEFVVNSYTTGSQQAPDVAFLDGGGFVVVWQSMGQNGPLAGVFAQRYDAAGAPLGGELVVSSHTESGQYAVDVAADPAGNFMVVWESFRFVVGVGNNDVLARCYDATGVAQGPEFTLNTYTTGAQRDAAATADASGHFVVAWTSEQGAGGENIFARRFDARGHAEGGEFLVNVYTTESQRRPAIAADAAGNFVVAWSSRGQDADNWGVFHRRFAPEVVFKDGFDFVDVSAR
jgi:hypothetical protein